MRPVLAAAIAALIWGLWWIPIRYLEALGLSGAWAGLVMNLGACLSALIWVVLTRQPLALTRRQIVGAALAGIAISAYSSALIYTDVTRAVLLFYLSPAWSKIIERVFLGMPWRGASTLAILAALAGAYFVLGGEISLSALNFGDLLALISGLSWAGGAALIFTQGRTSPISLTAVTAGFAVLASAPIAFAAIPEAARVLPVGLGLGLGLAYVLPIILLTLWSAQRLAPATLAFLLTGEILSGVISAGLLLDEPFGWMQAAGAALIIFAATTEVFASVGARRRDLR